MCFFVKFLIILFDILYSFTLHKYTVTNNNNISFVITIVTGEFTMLIQQKYDFKVCVIFFVFYSAEYKVYIHLPCINTQRQTMYSFDITRVISYINCQSPRLYQLSANCYEVDCILDIIWLLQPYQKIHYCNKSMLAIIADLNIFFWSNMLIGINSRSAMVHLFSIMCWLFV